MQSIPRASGCSSVMKSCLSPTLIPPWFKQATVEQGDEAFQALP